MVTEPVINIVLTEMEARCLIARINKWTNISGYYDSSASAKITQSFAEQLYDVVNA